MSREDVARRREETKRALEEQRRQAREGLQRGESEGRKRVRYVPINRRRSGHVPKFFQAVKDKEAGLFRP